MGVSEYLKVHWEGIVILITPIMFLPLIIINEDKAYKCIYTLLIMAVYWILEVIPLGMTGLIPLVMFPLFEIMPTSRICMFYFKNVMIMFLGSIMIASSIEYSQLHIRIAMKVVKTMGSTPARIHFSVCIVTMFLSMWIANSAATALMCPIIYAVLDEMDGQTPIHAYHPDDYDLPKKDRRPSQIALCLYLGAAYSASIGGTGVLIGTPTNLVYKGIYESRFPEATDSIDFGKHMIYATPTAILCVLAVFFVMEIQFFGMFRPNSEAAKETHLGKEGEELVQRVVDEKYEKLGSMNTHEITIGLLFIILVVLYVFRKPGFVKGWAEFFDNPQIKTGAPTVVILLLMFVMPTNYKFLKFWAPESLEKTSNCLDWEFVLPVMPWSLGIVIGSGASLAEGIKTSGMADLLGDWLRALDVLPPFVILLICVAAAMALTNLSANVAVCNCIIPIVAELTISCKIHPLYIIFPAGIACSFAFIMPVGTPPNAIVQAYANIPTKEMIKGGVPASLICIVMLWLISQLYGPILYPTIHEFPEWAQKA